MTTATKRTRRVTPLVVALVSLALTSLFVVRNLVAFDGDPTVFLAFGADDPLPREYAQSLLGEDIHLVPEYGHDGRFFFAQANDPLLLDPEKHAAVLDRPLYRAQRMLFPLLAGLGGTLTPWGVVWGMLGLSVATFAFGTYFAALIAERMGGSPWWGLAFGLNLGVISELLVGGSGHFGLALLLGAVTALQRGRPDWSLVCVVGAVLTREVFLVGAAGLAVWLWLRGRRRDAIAHAVGPLVAVGAWALYVRARIGWSVGVGVDEVQEIGWPVGGLIGSVEFWPRDPQSFAVGVLVVAILLLFSFRFLRAGWLVGYMALGMVPLALLLTRQVWFDYFNITRAISPVITAYVLMAFAGRNTPQSESVLAVRS